MYISVLGFNGEVLFFLEEAQWIPDALEPGTEERIILAVTCLENEHLRLQLELWGTFDTNKPEEASISRANNESVLGAEGFQWTQSETMLRVKYNNLNSLEALREYDSWASVRKPECN